MTLLNEEDKEWLSKNYPSLKVTAEEVTGVIEFTGTYSKEKNEFFLDGGEGVRLNGSFDIRIRERTKPTVSKLPALYVEGVDLVASRHFSPDRSACLCGVAEEGEFLSSQFQFIPFLEQLVIPFLYGQVFYSENGRWPWSEYSHGGLGILESYGKSSEPRKIKACLDALFLDVSVWPRVRVELSRKGDIKGSLLCFCSASSHMRKCHPDALQGVRQLKSDIRNRDLIWRVEELNKIFEDYKKGARVFMPLFRPLPPSAQAVPRYTLASSSSPELFHF